MTRTRLTLTLLAAAVCGCASARQADKPREIAPLSAGSFEVAWSADPGFSEPEHLYLAGNMLFVYGRDNVVSAFDLGGGLKFRTTVGEPGDVVGQPVVGPNRILFPTSATLEHYTLTGTKTKTQQLPQPVRSPGVLNGDALYIGSDSETGGRISKIDLARQYNIYEWSVLTGIVTTKPALFENAVYVATEDGKVIAINPDRSPLWAVGPEMPDGLFHADGKIIAPIKVDAGGVFVASTDTKLYCLAPNTGRIRWQYYSGTPLVAEPVATTDLVYQFVEGQGLIAIAKKQAARVASAAWTFAEGRQLLAEDAKYAYVLTDGRGVVAVNKADGTVAFRSQRADFTQAVTNLDAKNPATYALTEDGKVVCIRPVLRSGTVGELAMLTAN